MTTQSKPSNNKSSQDDAVRAGVKSATKASRDALQDGFDKTLKSAAVTTDYITANSEAVAQSLTLAGKGVEVINTEAASYFKTALETGMATAQAITEAKSLQEIAELQADYAKASMDAWLGELTTLGGLSTELFKTTLAPLNARLAATVELSRV